MEARAVREDPAPGDRRAELRSELAALEREREPLIVAAARAELLHDQAKDALAAARRAYDQALFAARSTASTAGQTRAALRRHDQAIREVRAELAARPTSDHQGGADTPP